MFAERESSQSVMGRHLILLIAYEYPPSPSPQSLRWFYLSRELVFHGFDVHVLTTDGGWFSPNIHVPHGVTVHRVSSNGVFCFLQRFKSLCFRIVFNLSKKLLFLLLGKNYSFLRIFYRNLRNESVLNPGELKYDGSQSKQNWKGEVADFLKRIAGWWQFPDARGRWKSSAQKSLDELLEILNPDLVISSHEPATTLQLGLNAKRAGFAWVADLGDPVLSFYTPRRWRKKSIQLERAVCKEADHLILTTDAAKQLLMKRHGIAEGCVSVFTQGYDTTVKISQAPKVEFDLGRLELLYSGTFYRYRHPGALIDAVIGTPGVRLSLAASRIPKWIHALIEKYPEKIRFLGFLPHDQVRAIQSCADVLINIANDDLVHLPGKFFEYLGAGRPILHISDISDDSLSKLLLQLRRGCVSNNQAADIKSALQDLLKIKDNSSWHESFDLEGGGILKRFEWKYIGERLAGLALELIQEARGD